MCPCRFHLLLPSECCSAFPKDRTGTADWPGCQRAYDSREYLQICKLRSRIDSGPHKLLIKNYKITHTHAAILQSVLGNRAWSCLHQRPVRLLFKKELADCCNGLTVGACDTCQHWFCLGRKGAECKACLISCQSKEAARSYISTTVKTTWESVHFCFLLLEIFSL